MNKTLYILACIAFCGTLHGKPLDQQIEKLPVDVQRHVAAIRNAVASNDWQTAREEYDLINWQDVKKPAVVLEALSKELKGDKDVKDLRQEIRTKYELLREGDDVDLDDKVTATPIPVVQIVVTRFPAMEIGQVELVVINVPALQYTDITVSGITIPAIDSKGVAVVVLRISDEKFMALMDLWEKRYSTQIDFWDDKGNKIVPAPGSVLGLERAGVIRAIEDGGDYEALWDAYNEHLRTAVGRRIALKHKRK